MKKEPNIFQKAVGYMIVAMIVLTLDIILSIVFVLPFHFILKCGYTPALVVFAIMVILQLLFLLALILRTKQKEEK